MATWTSLTWFGGFMVLLILFSVGMVWIGYKQNQQHGDGGGSTSHAETD